jgi:hypothetical protein
MLECFAESGRSRDGFSFGIDHRIADLGILRPERNLAPTHHQDLAFSGVSVRDDRLESLRSDIVRRAEIGH